MKRFPFPLRYSIPVILVFFGLALCLISFRMEIIEHGLTDWLTLPFADEMRGFLSSLGALLFLSVCIWYYLHKVIIVRSGLLLDSINRLSKGELTTRSKLQGSDELAELSEAFNKMADRIQSDTEALKRSEERFDLAMRGANDGLWDRDLTTNEIYFSPRWKDMLGYEDHEIPNHYDEWAKRVHQEDVNRVTENINAHLEGRTPNYMCEYRLRHRDGTYRWVLSRGIALRDAGGRAYRLAGSHTDITDRRNTEDENMLLQAQMLQAQKLESLGVLAGGIAHDFNNLLMSIRGNSDLAIKNLPESSPARRSVEKISDIVQRAAELTRQMLAYSGKGKFVIENVDLSELVESMTELLRVSIGKNVSIKCGLARNLPMVEGDATQLRQVIMNLIINASDAIGDRKGTVTVRTGEMECDRTFMNCAEIGKDLPEGTYVYLEVTDTGCGMDDETRAKIFDPFFTTKFTGRGLGLAAIHGIIRGHKGGLKVCSRVGEGTTFRITLPKSARQIEARQKDKNKFESIQGSGTILVIDDEEEIINVTRLMLESNGYGVLTACDGREGVDLFCRHRNEIAVVILDLTMPNMGGEEAFGEMKKCDDKVKVILTSGYNNEELTSRIHSEGFAGFLQKPYGLTDLLEKIQEVLQ